MFKYQMYSQLNKNKTFNNNDNIRNNITRNNIENFIKTKKDELILNEYDINENNIKYLVLFSCHCNSEIKYKTIINSLNYLNFDCIDIVLINSYNLPYNSKIREKCEELNIRYFENENMKTLDFGKWNYLLEKIDYTIYEHVVFINDSFIINGSLKHFFNLIYKNNVDLYGYNDSNQVNYHYQSYLFSIKKDNIPTFIKNYNKHKDNVNNQNDVINNYEVKMIKWFDKTNCFMNMAKYKLNDTNIFFHNDKLYFKLYNTRLLPFIKIKRIYK